jgi:hypothetical protein
MLILSQPVFTLNSLMLHHSVFIGEAANTNLIVFGLTRPLNQHVPEVSTGHPGILISAVSVLYYLISLTLGTF